MDAQIKIECNLHSKVLSPSNQVGRRRSIRIPRLIPPRGESKSTTVDPWYHEIEPGGCEWTLTEHVKLIVLPVFTYDSSGPQIRP